MNRSCVVAYYRNCVKSIFHAIAWREYTLGFYFVFLSSIVLQINLIAFRFYSAFADYGLGESALKMTKKA